jgi:hypothetical protein
MTMLERLLYRGPSWTELHEVYAKRHRVDDRAPIQSSNNIDIRAEVGKVWQVISEVTAWSTFNLPIGNARLYSPIAVDSAGELTIRGMRVQIKFAVADPNYELTWTGTALWSGRANCSGVAFKRNNASHLHESLAGAFVTLFLDNPRFAQAASRFACQLQTGLRGRHNSLDTRRVMGGLRCRRRIGPLL